ncbi:MAG: AAA family ATPase [Limisphaerales bacterium]
MLASSSKAGKTWVLLDLALSVTIGTKFLCWETSKGKVLFINFEIQKAFIKDRLEALMKRRGIEKPDGLDFWNLRGKATDFEALVMSIIKEVEGKNYALIIFGSDLQSDDWESRERGLRCGRALQSD